MAASGGVGGGTDGGESIHGCLQAVGLIDFHGRQAAVQADRMQSDISRCMAPMESPWAALQREVPGR